MGPWTHMYLAQGFWHPRDLWVLWALLHMYRIMKWTGWYAFVSQHSIQSQGFSLRQCIKLKMLYKIRAYFLLPEKANSTLLWCGSCYRIRPVRVRLELRFGCGQHLAHSTSPSTGPSTGHLTLLAQLFIHALIHAWSQYSLHEFIHGTIHSFIQVRVFNNISTIHSTVHYTNY